MFYCKIAAGGIYCNFCSFLREDLFAEFRFSRFFSPVTFTRCPFTVFYLYLVHGASSGGLAEGGLWIVNMKDVRVSLPDPCCCVSFLPRGAIAMPQLMLHKCICCCFCHMPYLPHAPNKQQLHILSFFLLPWRACTHHQMD